MLLHYTGRKQVQEILWSVSHPHWRPTRRGSKTSKGDAADIESTESRIPLVPIPVTSLQEFLWGMLNPQGDSKPPSAGKIEASEPPATVSVKRQSPPLFALIIGINDYKSDDVANLKGAVHDANAFQEFLEKDLDVPSSQIRNLRDGEATRAAIIQAFCDLKSDPEIKHGASITVFFAGHGGETEPPMGWKAGGDKVQMLIPHDFRSQLHGCDVHGIPDRSLITLLHNLAEVKGDNITVIFDCSHSGSSVRARATTHTCMARATEVPGDVPADLDQDIWLKGTIIPAGSLYHRFRSHVILAACGEKETAKEDNGQGLFTQALLDEITITGTDKITYKDLFQRIPSLPGQRPKCEGFNIGHNLFNSKAVTPRRVFYTVQLDGDNYIMSAGAAHGITDGAEFTVYQDQDSPLTAPPLGTLMVRDTNAFTSSMDVPDGSPIFSLPQPAFALQTKAGLEADLRLHIAMDERLGSVFQKLSQEMEAAGPDRRRILLVEKDQAELDIGVENGQVVFDVLNKFVAHFGTRLPYRFPFNPDDIFPVIRAAAHFQWHLRRINRKEIRQNGVRVEVRTVESAWNDDWAPVIRATGENLNCGGIVDILCKKKYGFKIINDTDCPLYPALFYFNNSDLSITSYYQLPMKGAAKVDAPLPPKGSLTIGYGPGSSPPFSFDLLAGQRVNAGFLKLFLSTKHVDHSNISQYSPFTKGKRGGVEVQPKTLSIRDAILMTVVIH